MLETSDAWTDNGNWDTNRSYYSYMNWRQYFGYWPIKWLSKAEVLEKYSRPTKFNTIKMRVI